MQKKLIASVLSLFCTWVLWSKESDGMRKSTVWDIDSGYETLSECKEGARQALERARKSWLGM